MTAALSPDFQLEIVGPAALPDLFEEWTALWQRCRSATPFQSPEWLLPWARHYADDRGGGAALRVDGQLAAFLPVFRWRGDLLLAGTGPSDYGDGLFLGGIGDGPARMVAALAASFEDRVDRIVFRQVRPISPLLRAVAPPGWSVSLSDDEPCPVLRLRGRDGMEAASAKLRESWRYAVRRIRREGGTLETAQGGEVTNAIAELETLHTACWRWRGEAGVFSDPLIRRFLRDAAPGLVRAGLARLHRLRFGDRTAGVLLVLLGHRQVHYYLSGFDPAWAGLSPGTALVGTVIAEAARDGATAFHFLRGREPYKYRWGAEDHPTGQLTLTPA